MFTAITFNFILVLGLVVTIFFARRYQGFEKWPAAVASTSVLLLWILARPALPLSGSEGWYVANLRLAPWTWQIDDGAWKMGFALLLLITAVILNNEMSEGQEPQLAIPIPVLALVVAIAALNAFWANSLSAVIVAWTIVSVPFILTSIPPPTGAESRRPWLRLGASWISLVPLGLAAATLPQASGLDMQGWPILTRSLILFASVLQLGVFPLYWSRPEATRLPRGVAALLYTVPAATGALLLARLEAGSATGMSYALPLTLLGLFSVVMAAITAAGPEPTSISEQRQRIASRAAMAQSGIILLAGIWAGPGAVLAEARVLLLAGGLIFLADDRENFLVRAAPLLAILAFAGAPLTAGFTGRALLFNAWLMDGRWVLALATMALYLLLLVTLLLLWRQTTAATDAPPDRDGWLHASALLLPALGLFSVAAVGATSPLVWVAILAPAAGSFLLLRFGETIADLPYAMRDVIVFPWSLPFSTAPLHRSAAFAGRALRQATTILEGEQGLLWLLLFLVVVWLLG